MNNHTNILVSNVNDKKIVITKIRNQHENLKTNPSQKSSKHNYNFVAPDGGWGWVVAVASGMCLVFTYPVLMQFGVLFREKFAKQGINSSQMTTILNVQQAAAMCSGLVNGPLFRNCTHRQAAIIGNLFVFVGLLSAAFANSFISYLISISLLFGTGRGIMFSTMTVTVNTYFKEKRQAATGLQYAVGGSGPIFLPYITTFLVGYYGVAGTVLLLSGLSLNNLVCSATYQPVKWHLKKVPKPQKLRALTLHTEDSDSAEQLNFLDCKLDVNSSKMPNTTQEEENEEMLKKPKKPPTNSSILKQIVVMFDLELLKDLGYINIAMGLTLMNLMQMNFIYLMPFIFHEFGLNRDQTATAMSVEAVFALVTKILVVFIVGRIRCENKTWLLWASFALICGRIVLMSSRNYIVILISMVWIGLFSGLSLIFWVLILPSYVPLERLPGALGLQRLIMGICYLIIGPFIGLVRDATNFVVILHIMNVVIGAVIVLWICEDFYRKRYPTIRTEK